MKTYPIEVLLSISTGVLLCPFGDMHECVEYLAGQPVFTHQLAFKPFVDQLKAAVVTQYPDLAVNSDHVTPENWQQFRADCIAKLGHSRDIIPMVALTADTIGDSFTEPLEGKKVIGIEV